MSRVLGKATACVIAVRTVSESNAHEHWRKRQVRAKSQRLIACTVCSSLLSRELPAVVTLTRIAPRALDSDNLQGALKHVRDGVADSFGVKDNDPRLTWEYGQERGRARECAVRVEVREAMKGGAA